MLHILIKDAFYKFAPSEVKNSYMRSLCPIGRSPFELSEGYKTWASPDECDCFIHLSNSSYSKLADMILFKFAMRYLTNVFREGCHFVVVSSHLQFIKEIPLGQKYEMQLHLETWDSKSVCKLSRYYYNILKIHSYILLHDI